MPCSVCEEVVTTPLCSSCVQEGVKEWLQYAAPELIDELAQFSENGNFSLSDAKCVRCHNSINTCPYCCTESLYDWLAKTPKLRAQFLEFFNFDLWHSGYSTGR